MPLRQLDAGKTVVDRERNLKKVATQSEFAIFISLGNSPRPVPAIRRPRTKDPSNMESDHKSNSALRPTFIEGQGVFVPVINKVIAMKDEYDGRDVPWSKAKGLTATRDEWYIILYWKDEIDQLLKEHGGDPLIGWYWTDTEYQFYSAYAWHVTLSYGLVIHYTKTGGNQVRLVSAFNNR